MPQVLEAAPGKHEAPVKRESATIVNDPLWYKDAIIYEVHVRSFYDSVDDGMGDFPGLTQKLDYIQDLGVTAALGFALCASPRDGEGEPIAHYTPGLPPSLRPHKF